MSDRMLNICLVGAGRAGMIHAQNFAHRIENARITAVVDVVAEAAKASAGLLGCDKAYTDYRQALEETAIDAVIVASPTDIHKSIVQYFAAAGKHIFCEKPMGMNVADCDEMVAACKHNHVKLQIGFMRRHDMSFKDAKRLLDEGAIGDLVQIHSSTRGPSKPRPWMYDLKKSNGILAEVNSHDIDAVRWFAGSEIKELYALAGNFRNPEAIEEYPDYYDSVLMNGSFENGVHFSIDGAAYVQYGYDSKMEVIGTKGVLHIGRPNANFVRCTTVENGTTTPFIDSWRTLFADAYLAEDIAFAQAVLNDTEPLVTGIDGKQAVRIVEAGNLSISSKSIVRL